MVPRNQAPVPKWTTIDHHHRVSFRDALRAARNEIALAHCPKKPGHDAGKEYGPLVSSHWIAHEYGLSPHQARHVPRAPNFPKPVAMLWHEGLAEGPRPRPLLGPVCGQARGVRAPARVLELR